MADNETELIYLLTVNRQFKNSLPPGMLRHASFQNTHYEVFTYPLFPCLPELCLTIRAIPSFSPERVSNPPCGVQWSHTINKVGVFTLHSSSCFITPHSSIVRLTLSLSCCPLFKMSRPTSERCRAILPNQPMLDYGTPKSSYERFDCFTLFLDLSIAKPDTARHHNNLQIILDQNNFTPGCPPLQGSV